MMKHHGDEPAVVEMACDWAYQNKRYGEALGLALTLVVGTGGWGNVDQPMAIRIDMRDWAAMVKDAEQAIARFPLNRRCSTSKLH